MDSNIINRVLSGKFVLIAEVGVNYYDIAKKYNITPMEAAKMMIKKARCAGVHAVKFQTYKAGTIASKNSPSYWDTREEPITSQYELFKKFDSFGFREYKKIADYCNEIGIEFLSTAFDFESADYLYDLMGAYKISSSDLTNLPFVEYQSKKGKPMLLSIGASNEDEIDKTIQIIKQNNNKPIVLLHCVLEYPTPFEHANLNRIVTLKKKYPDLIIGYSDHTKPDKNMDVVKTAFNLGALIVEKHYTLDKTLSGNDHYHSMDDNDAKKVIDDINFINSLRGSYEIKFLETEASARRNARRSVVSNVNIKSGQMVAENMLTYKRPGTGIIPADVKKIIGKIAKNDIDEDTILQFNMFE